MCQCAKVLMCQCAMAHLCLFANLLLASFSAAGHTCPGTNSWCYMSFEDFVLVLFLEFRAPYFIRQKDAFFKKGNFPPTDLAENLCMEPQKPPISKFKSWQMGFFWPKNNVKGRGIEEGWYNTWGTRLSTTACSSTEVTSARYPPLSKSFYRISTPAKHIE